MPQATLGIPRVDEPSTRMQAALVAGAGTAVVAAPLQDEVSKHSKDHASVRHYTGRTCIASIALADMVPTLPSALFLPSICLMQAARQAARPVTPRQGARQAATRVTLSRPRTAQVRKHSKDHTSVLHATRTCIMQVVHYRAHMHCVIFAG